MMMMICCSRFFRISVNSSGLFVAMFLGVRIFLMVLLSKFNYIHLIVYCVIIYIYIYIYILFGKYMCIYPTSLPWATYEK